MNETMDSLYALVAASPQWAWLVLGVFLCVAEIIAPGFYLSWVGLAAILTAGATAVFGLAFVGQALLFFVIGAATVYAARQYFQRHAIPSADPLLNDRAARLVGSVVTAVEPIDASQGRVKVGDSVWSAKGTHAAIGDRLRVTGCDGMTLLVEPA